MRSSLFLVSFFIGFSIHILAQPAFPEAVGYGAASIGGRGGDVYHVTKLDDDGSQGTLRHALSSATGPRTIVFDVGGIIHLEGTLKSKKSNITIAGQTAPGGGITIAGHRLDIEAPSGTRIHDIIIRYISLRPGDFNAKERPADADKCLPLKPAQGNANLGGAGGDAIFAENVDRLILDHISASWGMDENIDFTTAEDVTVQNSIVSEGLLMSFHDKGHHSRGFLSTGGVKVSQLNSGSGGYTLAYNLIAHNNMRSPLVGAIEGPSTDDPNDPDAIFQHMDFINNVVYNWGERSGHTGRTNTLLNYTNNYLIAGPSTGLFWNYTACTDGDGTVNLNIAMREEGGSVDDGPFLIYHSGNFMDTDKDSNHDGNLVGDEAFAGFDTGEIISSPHPYLTMNTILTAQEAYEKVLAEAGSSLNRDAIDTRIVNDVINRTGAIIDSQEDIGGLVEILDGTPPTDTDQDGMPDIWETDNGLDLNNAADRNDTNLSSEGYTNLEVYLNSIIENTTLGIGDYNGIDIVVCPNPTRDNEITIKLPITIIIDGVIIYDISGKEVFDKKIQSPENKILLKTNLSKGVYIVKIISEKGSLNKKIIIE